MAITIAVAMQKGGVGKSTTAQAMANILGCVKHKKVLLIDLDSQANTTYASGIDNPEKTITDVLGEECSAQTAVIQCKYYDLLAADKYLTNVEQSLVDTPDLKGLKDKLENAGVFLIDMLLLKNVLIPLQEQYDYIVIDTPPALGNLSYMAMTAADYVLIPAEPSVYGLTGLGDIHNTILAIQNGSNPRLKTIGILLVKYNRRTLLSRDVRDMIDDYSQQMNTSIFNSTIRESIAVREAQMVRKPLLDYASSNNANIDYKGFVTELVQRIETDRRQGRNG